MNNIGVYLRSAVTVNFTRVDGVWRRNPRRALEIDAADQTDSP